MIEQLKIMFQVQAKQERFETLNAFIGCKMDEGSSVSAHLLACLRLPFGDELATDVLLASLPKSFNQERSINELHNMVKNAEANIKKSGNNQVLMICEDQISKKKNGNNIGKGKDKVSKKGKGKGKGQGKPLATNPTPKPKPAADSDYFHCNERGDWKCKCPKYLKEVKKNKANLVGTSGIYVIKYNSWVFSTRSGTKICNDLQGLKNVRELRDGNLELHVGNGTRVVVKAIGQYLILLPNGVNLILNNCCYVPSITNNIISISRLYEQHFHYKFDIYS
uniref:Retrovirus-related Pol polyprotein from transposon TNT 1-94-like beta-barrel domain-containing protein n=1 Tax=Lactuca sativa TaxID=4236 RepID=A0A9R1X356_LACSA|nr:hypothetical protein LSAT_V11C700362150 [Lactuca sativa]